MLWPVVGVAWVNLLTGGPICTRAAAGLESLAPLRGDEEGQGLGVSGFLVGSAVFKAVEALFRSAWWVRFPSAPVHNLLSYKDLIMVDIYFDI